MNIEELLSELDIPFKPGGEHKNVRHGFIGVDCPNCSPNSEKFLMGIPEGGYFATCWACGYSNLAYVISRLGEIPYNKAKELTGELDEIPFENTEFKKRGKLVLPYGICDLLPIQKKYLVSRGFNPSELAAKWQIQGIGVSDRLAYRLFIPIIFQGRIVSWTTRAITQTEGGKYIAADQDEEEIHHKSILFGEDLTRHSIIIHEGVMDVFATGPGAVATMGIGYTKEQLIRIIRYPKRFIVFDCENRAQERARKLCDELSVFRGKTKRIEIDAKDTADAQLTKTGRSELKRLRRYVFGKSL